MPTVLNKTSDTIPNSAVYIGRPSVYGNKFQIGLDGNRAEVIFKHWLSIHKSKKLLKLVRSELQDTDLVCWCAPKACHGDTLLRIANAPAVVASFRGQFDFLSNFYNSPVKSNHGLTYPTSEHAYQAMKSTKPSDRFYIASLKTAADAKRASRSLSIRPDWENVKRKLMYKIVLAKFTQNIDLTMRLIDTLDSELVEGNYWNDTYWGVCNGDGENHLGRILMKVRAVLYKQYIEGN
jgi:ribA/ribD-fused uncharacterized protein